MVATEKKDATGIEHLEREEIDNTLTGEAASVNVVSKEEIAMTRGWRELQKYVILPLRA